MSGPLLDRIDLHVEMPRTTMAMFETSKEESSETVRARVVAARLQQLDRFKDTSLVCNAEMTERELERYCVYDSPTRHVLESAVTKMRLSARSYHRILRVSRTIADLALRDLIQLEDVAEALQYRFHDDAQTI